MRVIRARNINQAWDAAKDLLNSDHVIRQSRVGQVMECTEPVTTIYQNPLERVLFNPERNCNHYFHVMEALWCLAGREDTAWLANFNPRIWDFVGREPIMHGAYGYRWRYSFDLDGGAEDDYADQLVKIARMLKKNKDERRAVLTMWNPIMDLERPDVKDLPCNLIVTFKIRDGKLDMIVFCRSNDICFGAYGSNQVQFSYLIEYMSAMIGVPVGTYWQVSDSWHAYTERWESLGGFSTTPTPDYYQDANWPSTMAIFNVPAVVHPFPLVSAPESFDEELWVWMARQWEQGEGEFPADHFFRNDFFPNVAEPLWQSWAAYKAGNMSQAIAALIMCQASDWRLACERWLLRVQAKRDQKFRKEVTA